MIIRDQIFEYVRNDYGVEPDRPFMNFPSYCVLRHQSSKKWFALIMDVPREKLGLEGAGRVDIINLKLNDPLLVDLLVRQEGYLRGYHISGGNWISVLLDGSVDFEKICALIDESYSVTDKKERVRDRSHRCDR